MIVGTILTVVMAAGGSADALTQFQVKNVAVQVPAAWTRSNEDGTAKFTAPSGDAYFLVDVGAVQTAGMKAQVCVDKIVTGSGGTGWEKLKVGGQPAARRLDTDASTNGALVDTWTYVGCDGRTTWSVVFHLEQGKKERFAPLAEKVAGSVKFQRARGK
ncbi:hypothetical protein OWM54_37790 [Myxococcus sp. MISCRS1]|jgi:hypothetical protein|uniref:Uncharacterized protein n=1 Tax=Myxococcus fulvus TaxID=33 RepID=A0A511T558_MYXFU|nr:MULTISPECIES: hypothetical protein [Myxococcus]AKF82263.1 hypothetical protein MFUL124B02_26685 [Myxococcus fulvus 124B02]BDT35496.1 hypothetical protein MFMH1_51650 [Myxococcus sp. MH1]MBZ4401641.1 hypothetical protein [Myxococcus sp. AS-1-15]MBZ4409366.1 hypothetical protein [Myxococcus sp. XM-1-1-1]MCK8501724.1 hypothetical protein [Myxococcus fulvus]